MKILKKLLISMGVNCHINNKQFGMHKNLTSHVKLVTLIKIVTFKVSSQ
jgi:hypothetical protein